MPCIKHNVILHLNTASLKDISATITEHYGNESVSVIIEFLIEDYVIYIVNVSSYHGITTFTTRNAINLTVLYNVRYDIDLIIISALYMCQNNLTKNFELFYGER